MLLELSTALQHTIFYQTRLEDADVSKETNGGKWMETAHLVEVVRAKYSEGVPAMCVQLERLISC